MKKKLAGTANAGINRPVITLINNLQAHLGHPVRGSGYVHRIRVDIKRLRAWIRLIRNEENAVGLRAIDHDLRDIMKKLSMRRDRQALVETLKWLEKKADKNTRLSSLNVIRSHMDNRHERIPIDWTNIKTALLHVLAILKQYAQKIDSIHSVREGLQRTYKRAARSGDKAFSGKVDLADLHEFRKWVKYLFYQLELVQAACPELAREMLDDLEDLGYRLGRLHDLVPVKKRLGGVSDKKKYSDAKKQMDNMIDESMYKLLRRAHRHYRKIFSSSASRFAMDLQ